ncbi:MAG: DUF362 domain-containing protein [Candidatus Lokiarchaeota archaeon]|nr:DUF362 domain-containing protein [Candidatus Lokiarchaeota archaeon]
MNKNSKINSTEVAIIKSSSPSKLITTGIEKLGGISAFIEKGDQIFIKINLSVPNGFPVNVNFESLRDLIILCKGAGAKRIFIGSFPEKGVSTQSIANILGIQSYLESFGGELLFLEDQNNCPLKDLEIKDKIIKIPKVILESDKLIIFNQVSVDPLFKITLSLMNSYSLVPNRYQRIEKIMRSGKDYLLLDQYKQDLISNILNVYSIKRPDLIINDIYYFLEGAGPFVYRNSNLISPRLGIIGRDGIAVDLITLKLFGIDLLSSDILLEARNRKLGITDLSNITILGERVENINLKVNFSVYRLDDIDVKNTTIKAGRICSGCFKEVYRLLNYMNTHMTKDLKYIKKQYFLTGENPPEPESLEHIIVFGECAICSTKNRAFRNVRISSDRNYIEDVKGKIKKDYKSQKTPKVKEKINKNIIEIPGCPPNLYESLFSIHKYYGKSQTPNLSFYKNLIKTYYEQASKSNKSTGD